MSARNLILLALIAAVQSKFLPELLPNDIPNFLTYEDARNAVMDAEDQLSIGGSVVLSPKEVQANKIFMKHKLSELSKGFTNADKNAPGMHFFKAKKLIEDSKVFQMLKEMPKGAVLHAHNSAAVSSDWVIRNLTYMPGLLSCQNGAGLFVFSFRKSSDHGCRSGYSVVDDKRVRTPNRRAFDRTLEGLINLYSPTPEVRYSTIDKVWTRFQSFFGTMSDVLKYLPAFRAYHWRLLEEMYEDGIMYIELRMDFKTLYDEEGNDHPPEFAITELTDIVERFKELHPDFLGVKAILSTNRRVEPQKVQKKLDQFKKLHEKFPNFVIGFDLVGQEDLGYPLHDFVEVLKDLPPTAKYFFHAGETNWYGSSTDYNLLDAILLNTTRIGHGYALAKHPVLWNAVKQRDIAIEVSPISNQVLHLVWDLRNHPAAFFFSENIPVVITNDDPGFWNSKGLSYDFYYAIMSFAPDHSGLRTLKELVWNSIKYSVLTDMERKEAYAILTESWEKFLDKIIFSNKFNH